MPNITVRPVHFEDFGGHEFERLVFAYLLWAGWRDVAWYGQTGSDQGRDIIGTEPFDDEPDRRTVVQCVNRATLTLAKAKHDMKGAVAAATGAPNAFRFVCRSNVSSQRRDEVEKAGKALGIVHVDVWSGGEFEEHLRLRGEFLLKRFVDGVPFPDDGEGLTSFVNAFADLDDDAALALMREPFDRAAFWTPFYAECSLSDFQQAIGDTIGALSTGVWKTRDGVEIRRLPSLRDIRDVSKRRQLERIVRDLDSLRRLFKRHLEQGSIRPCQCGVPGCPTFMLDEGVGDGLDRARAAILDRARAVIPAFDIRME